MKASKDELKKAIETDSVDLRENDFSGMNVSWETFHKRVDTAQLLEGLPNNMCQSHHWGYVIKGKSTVHYKDRDEVFSAGDIFYMEPGHTVIEEAGTEVIEFSPVKEFRETIRVAAKNLERLEKQSL
jgi:hypothetical protein